MRPDNWRKVNNLKSSLCTQLFELGNQQINQCTLIHAAVVSQTFSENCIHVLMYFRYYSWLSLLLRITSAPSSSKSSAVGLQSEIDFDLSNRSVPINKHKNNVITHKYRSIQRLHQRTVVFPHSTAIRHIPVRFPVNCPSAAYKRFNTQPDENNVRFKAYYTYLIVN